MKLEYEFASRIIREIVVTLLLCEENGLDNDPEKAIRIKIVWKETH
jgi:hypothetical protein